LFDAGGVQLRSVEARGGPAIQLRGPVRVREREAPMEARGSCSAEILLFKISRRANWRVENGKGAATLGKCPNAYGAS
jgi:hypothetical protein